MSEQIDDLHAAKQLRILQWVTVLAILAPWLVPFSAGYLMYGMSLQYYERLMPWVALGAIIGFPLFALAMALRFHILKGRHSWNMSVKQEKKFRGIVHGIIMLMAFYGLLFGLSIFARS